MPKEKPELSDAMRAKMSGKTPLKNPIKGTKFTIAISSAKGGVGKSTFATNLAVALKKVGCKVGLLDADIYGPSVPKMLGINEKAKSDGRYFLFGILNCQKGISKISTIPILSDDIRIGGTESFNANFVIGKALP